MSKCREILVLPVLLFFMYVQCPQYNIILDFSCTKNNILKIILVSVTQILDLPDYNEPMYKANLTKPIVKESNNIFIHYTFMQN